MVQYKKFIPGLGFTAALGIFSLLISGLIPGDLIGSSVFALLFGMLLNPVLKKIPALTAGVQLASGKVLRLGIILMGITLSFSQVLFVGKYALLLMTFTLLTAFGGGHLLGSLFKVNWKLTSLLSASTAICGGTAVATLGPAIEAEDRDIAYAISATFLFDLLTVIAFPWIGHLLRLSDTSYGLWVGTAVNDTSSVVAAGYGFSEAAGSFAVIVKLTRTLFIVPVVLVFSYIHARSKARAGEGAGAGKKIKLSSIFPWFILAFLAVVALKSTGLVPQPAVTAIARLSKLFMVMALSAIGLKTSFQEIKGIGWKPMLLGVSIDTSVVFVALGAQALIQAFV
ncbi:putative sulfate exporter family transporter [Oscillospiraceae bacterium MB08-C2-2]|nr:putative sulfate exporter family transporter [Oscillospiraceae bacterium MB08-C2-2]